MSSYEGILFMLGGGKNRKPAVSLPTSIAEDFSKDHKESCISALNRIRSWSKELNLPLVTNDLVAQELIGQFHRGTISISVFGPYNTGKSSLLNALLRNRLLPIGIDERTSIRTYIQHDDNQHLQQCSSGSCQNCPKLYDFEREGYPIACGEKSIREKLRYANNGRLSARLFQEDKLLRAYVPVLKDIMCSLNRNVFLVDNPGLQDCGSERSSELAETASILGTAYIYVMDYTYWRGADHIKAMKELYRRDKGVFSYGRTLIVVNKFDNYYVEDDGDGDEDHLAVSEIKDKVCVALEKALNLDSGEISRDIVVPVSSKWASAHHGIGLRGRGGWVGGGGGGGGGGACRSLVTFSAGMAVPDFEAQSKFKLEKSRIGDLEMRIKMMMVQLQQHWLKHMKLSTLQQLDNAIAKLSSALHKNSLCIKAKSEECTKMKNLQDEVERYKELLRNCGADIEEALERSYYMDVEVKRKEGIELADTEHKCFSSAFHSKAKYSLSEFHDAVKMYLEDISVKLNVLYGEILFQEVTDTHAETMVRLKENCIHLELKTKSFCEMDEYDTCLSEDGYDSESGSFDEEPDVGKSSTSYRQKPPPNFAKLAKKIHVPDFQPAFFQRVLQSFRLLFQRIRNAFSHGDNNSTPSSSSSSSSNDQTSKPDLESCVLTNSEKLLSMGEVEAMLVELDKVVKHECFQYFEDIKHLFVQHYSEKYRKKKKTELHRFAKYERQVKRQSQYSQKLQQETAQLRIKERDYNERLLHLEHLTRHILERYEESTSSNATGSV